VRGTNFSNYIDRSKFSAKPHSAKPVTFDFQHAKPFHRVTNGTIKEMDAVYGHIHSKPVVPERPFTYPSTLGKPSSLRKYVDEPFGFATSAFPVFDRSWKAPYLPHAYAKNLVGKTETQIQHDVKLSHAREPSNGGVPRKAETTEPAEWAQQLLDDLGAYDEAKSEVSKRGINPLQNPEELRKEHRNLKKRNIAERIARSATSRATVAVGPVSALLSSSTPPATPSASGKSTPRGTPPSSSPSAAGGGGTGYSTSTPQASSTAIPRGVEIPRTGQAPHRRQSQEDDDGGVVEDNADESGDGDDAYQGNLTLDAALGSSFGPRGDSALEQFVALARKGMGVSDLITAMKSLVVLDSKIKHFPSLVYNLIHNLNPRFTQKYTAKKHEDHDVTRENLLEKLSSFVKPSRSKSTPKRADNFPTRQESIARSHEAFSEHQSDIQVRNSSASKNTPMQFRLQRQFDEAHADETRKAERAKQLGRQNP
jgi:hypothetical protein